MGRYKAAGPNSSHAFRRIDLARFLVRLDSRTGRTLYTSKDSTHQRTEIVLENEIRDQLLSGCLGSCSQDTDTDELRLRDQTTSGKDYWGSASLRTYRCIRPTAPRGEMTSATHVPGRSDTVEYRWSR
jgi:hypothetical protein